MASVSLSKITKSFGGHEVLHGIDLEIGMGEFIVFVGPSGCGKSTMLRVIAGLEEITSGTLTIDGEVANGVPPGERGIAMVFQSYALYPHMTVYDNMAFGLKVSGMAKPEIDRRVRKAAEMLELTPYLDRLPRSLSGGQRQRVAIGRAVTRDPKVFLFDEPLSNLDAALRVATRLEIADLNAAMPDTTMIYVTHDQVEAMTLADRIVVFNEGRIEQVGRPLDLYERPRNLFVARFIGSPKMNVVKGEAATVYQAAMIGIRPEHLAVSAHEGLWPGKVKAIEHLGSDTFLHVEAAFADEPLIVRGRSDVPLRQGDTVHLTPEVGKIHRFNEDGVAFI
ncbi:ATP-binding cassette domain-containing protein [Jiella sp. MQZ9-1]|uniref:ATP-binding cassette domain-containing protein n=1 Tax=Jiella flava TaxID=2816857 RepID=A0A939FSY4_9HYPH|nr:ATP-binding cassette domain-containing protein [Jiella flava]MBO0660972.1 ATP-binding cassette domain-containing protein [Jiella flava]MCD2469620.1 ATP-binding cassette domain-containing protein [Jiella flava]